MTTRAPLKWDPIERVRVLQRALEAATAELETLRALAYTDPLTGLRNRRAFEQRLGEELSRARRAEGTFTVLMLDLDDFKQINDSRGHLEGDTVLKSVAVVLEETFREHDVVCRTGGDEFVVILPDSYREELGTALARLRHRLSTADQGGPVVVSIGAASYPHDATTSAQLVACADHEMYRAKRRRKAACTPEYDAAAVPMTESHGEETQT